MPLLQTQGLTRRFPGVLALDNVSFAADAGEVHAVCGANGAGKSTLMNVLAGVLQPSAGSISVAGERCTFSTPAAASAAGVATVYQEFSSIPELSVADNIFLGREFLGRLKTLDRGEARRQTTELFARLGIHLGPDRLVGDLGVADRQLVEIARALAGQARILILDEPTAVLAASEQEKLFSLIRGLKAQGLLVLYISHRLEEIFEIADMITVMRDGKLVGTRKKDDLSEPELIRMMTGADTAVVRPPAALASESPTVLRVNGVTADGSSLDVRAGEIFGLAGLVGSGRTNIAHRVAGLRPRRGMSAELHGEELAKDPARILRSGVFYLTEDRKRDGIFGPIRVVHNATAAALGRFSRGGLVSLLSERDEASSMLTRLKLVAASLDASIDTLSGGNQQKVLFARALLTRPKVLICDEPTRGVDIGAKQEIYAILHALASEGVAVVLISSELNEVLALSHRIGIVRDGQITEVLANINLDHHQLVAAAIGSE